MAQVGGHWRPPGVWTRYDRRCTHPLSRWQVLLMAFATGVAVASNYYAQPLLHTIAGEFGVSFGRAGTLVTAAQLSYGVGVVLLVPWATCSSGGG